MRWRMRTQTYLPLALLFWLFVSVGGLVIGIGIRQTPQGLGGVTAYMSQGVEGLIARALSGDVYAAQSEAGPSAPTAAPTPPTTPPPPHTAAPATPQKAGQNGDGDGKHKGHGGGGDGHKGKGDNGDNNSDGSGD